MTDKRQEATKFKWKRDESITKQLMKTNLYQN